MELLDKYFEVQKEVYKYFGYVEDWVVIPIDDATMYYWHLIGELEVHFADTPSELKNQDGNYYVNEVYRQRFLPKWIYEGENYTMICVDTHTDGNKFLQIFSNSLRRDF